MRKINEETAFNSGMYPELAKKLNESSQQNSGSASPAVNSLETENDAADTTTLANNPSAVFGKKRATSVFEKLAQAVVFPSDSLKS